MAQTRGNPEVTAAVLKGAIAETILLVIGGAIFLGAGEIAWMIGAALVGSAILLFLMAQARAFNRP
jgi:hypothetical protein